MNTILRQNLFQYTPKTHQIAYYVLKISFEEQYATE